MRSPFGGEIGAAIIDKLLIQPPLKSVVIDGASWPLGALSKGQIDSVTIHFNSHRMGVPDIGMLKFLPIFELMRAADRRCVA